MEELLRGLEILGKSSAWGELLVLKYYLLQLQWVDA